MRFNPKKTKDFSPEIPTEVFNEQCSKKEFDTIISCTQSSQPPRAIQWATFKMMERWTRNSAEGSNGCYTFFHAVDYLKNHKEKYKEFLDDNNLPYFTYDKDLFDINTKPLRTTW